MQCVLGVLAIYVRHDTRQKNTILVEISDLIARLSSKEWPRTKTLPIGVNHSVVSPSNGGKLISVLGTRVSKYLRHCNIEEGARYIEFEQSVCAV